MTKDDYHTFHTVFGSHSQPRSKRPRTSITHPLQIATVQSSGIVGRIGVTFCPGKKDSHALTGAWDRDLNVDLESIREWGASVLVTLIEDHEFDLLSVRELPDVARDHGLEWFHLPIRDVSIPDELFEQSWETIGKRLRDYLREGRSIVVHCRGGLGRAGMIAAKLLVELGHDSEDTIRVVREVRPGAIETGEQERYVLRQGKAHD